MHRLFFSREVSVSLTLVCFLNVQWLPWSASFVWEGLVKKRPNSVFLFSILLTLYAPISQNSQTHSNNASANCLSVFDHFVGLALKGLRLLVNTFWSNLQAVSGIQACNFPETAFDIKSVFILPINNHKHWFFSIRKIS